jgi:hypothetical protein
MRHDYSSSRWHVWILGAINGLLVGVAAEWVNNAYIQYSVRKSFAEGWDVVDMHSPTLIPFLSVVLFALSGYFLGRYWWRQFKSPVLLWPCAGLVSATAYALIHFVNFIRWQPWIETAVVWIIGAAIAVAVSFVYGIVVHLLLGSFSHDEGLNLP